MNMSPKHCGRTLLSMQIIPGCWPTGWKDVAAFVLSRRSCWLTASRQLAFFNQLDVDVCSCIWWQSKQQHAALWDDSLSVSKLFNLQTYWSVTNEGKLRSEAPLRFSHPPSEVIVCLFWATYTGSILSPARSREAIIIIKWMSVPSEATWEEKVIKGISSIMILPERLCLSPHV